MLIAMQHDVRRLLGVVVTHRTLREVIENRSKVMHISFAKKLHLQAFRVILNLQLLNFVPHPGKLVNSLVDHLNVFVVPILSHSWHCFPARLVYTNPEGQLHFSLSILLVIVLYPS